MLLIVLVLYVVHTVLLFSFCVLYLILAMSLNCPYLVIPSVVCLILANVSGFSIFGYPFGIVPDIGDVSGLSIFCYSFDIVPDIGDVSGLSIFGYPFDIVPDIGDVSGLSIFGYPFGNLVVKNI